MVSTKALAAIALTLIIAMPIGIGFLTAVHQEETDSWQTTSSSKISDLMLNNQTPYYGSYKGISNNSNLIGENNAAPDYVTITSTITSLPTYEDTVTSGNTPKTAHTLGASDTLDSSSHPTAKIINISPIFGDRVLSYTLANETNGQTTLAAGSMGAYILKDDESGYQLYIKSTNEELVATYTHIGKITTWSLGTGGGSAYYELGTGSEFTTACSFYFMNEFAIWFNGIGHLYSANQSVKYLLDRIEISGVSYALTSPGIYVDSTNYTKIESVATGEYADPSDGWTVPTTSDRYQWLNNQDNRSVTFYVKVDKAAEQTAQIGNLFIYNVGTQVGAYLISEGSESGRLLGAYTYLQIVMSTEGYTITGLASWPAMGTVPTTYNSIEFNDAIETFATVDIEATSTNWHFRVDNANIKQGTYPSTYDYTLNLQQIYPDTNIDIYLNSIGIYGDYINFGGALMTVENGSVTINGQTYRLLHAHLSAWADEGGHYSLRINGDEVATTSEPPTIFWGGEWSVTATAYKIEKVHEYVTVWHAGEFGLDKKGFAVAGLLACAAMFVALGMTGQRSGGKAGVLLLICGGAAIVFLLII